MNNYTNYILRGVLFAGLLIVSISLHAQVNRRVFDFKQGEQYQTELLTNSSTALKRGNQILHVNSVTSGTKLYTVTDVSNNEYKFTVEIKKMDNLIEALGEKLHYNSETPIDSTSSILRALDFMIKKPIKVTIDKNGIIQSSTDYKVEMATDTLVSFAGLQSEVFEKQSLFGLIADLTYSDKLTKGYTWTDSTNVNQRKLKTKFTIEEITKDNTIVKFSSAIESKLINSNTNGTYVIDNKTGLITEKLLYIISVGYQISAGNTVYAVSRSTSVTERTKKIN